MIHSIIAICPATVCVWHVSVNTVNAPYNSFHCAHQLLRSALPGVDGRGRGLVQMGLCRSPHLAAVVVDMATLAVADRPVAMAPTAASREAGDHSPPNMRATVLQKPRNVGRRRRRRRRKRRRRDGFIFISGQQATKQKHATITANQPITPCDKLLKIVEGE